MPRVLDMTEGEGLRRYVLLRNAFRSLEVATSPPSSRLSVSDLTGADSGYSEDVASDRSDDLPLSSSLAAVGVSVCDYDFGGEEDLESKMEGVKISTTTVPASTKTKSEAQWFDELLFEMGSAQVEESGEDANEELDSDGDSVSDSEDELSGSEVGEEEEDEVEVDFSPFSRSTTVGEPKARHPLARVWPRRPLSRSPVGGLKPTVSRNLSFPAPSLDHGAKPKPSVGELAGLELDLSKMSPFNSAIPMPKATGAGIVVRVPRSSTTHSLASSASSLEDCPALVRDDGEDDEDSSTSSSDSEVESDQGHGQGDDDDDALLRPHVEQHYRIRSTKARKASSFAILPASPPSSKSIKVKGTPSSVVKDSDNSFDLLRSVSSIRALSESAWRNEEALLLHGDEGEDGNEDELGQKTSLFWPPRRAW